MTRLPQLGDARSSRTKLLRWDQAQGATSRRAKRDRSSRMKMPRAEPGNRGQGVLRSVCGVFGVFAGASENVRMLKGAQ
jgi:hypothetical protein